MLQVESIAVELRDDFQHPPRIAGFERLRHLFQQIEGEASEQCAHFVGHKLCSAAGDGLIQRRQRIAHAAISGLRQDGEHFGVRIDAFLFANPLHARDQVLEVHATKTEMLAAAGDGGGDLVRFGGAQDEHGPLGRFFQCLQQRVERFVGDLVRFVDDENFVAVARGTVAYVLAQFAHFVDAAIGRRVDLDHIHGAAGRDLHATGAHAARLVGGTFDAVQAARHDARHRGLAGAALARKDVAVRDASLCDGVFKSGADVLLAD